MLFIDIPYLIEEKKIIFYSLEFHAFHRDRKLNNIIHIIISIFPTQVDVEFNSILLIECLLMTLHEDQCDYLHFKLSNQIELFVKFLVN